MVRLLVKNVHGMIVEYVVPGDPYLGHLSDFEQIYTVSFGQRDGRMLGTLLKSVLIV